MNKAEVVRCSKFENQASVLLLSREILEKLISDKS